MFALVFLSGCGLLLDFDPPDLDPDLLDASSGVDASADAYTTDSGLLVDANVESMDADLTDADLPNPCSDEPGLCIRMTDAIVPEITGFYSNVYWTVAGGAVAESGWTLETCEGGIRSIAPTTIDCHFSTSDLPSDRSIYFYPRTSAGAACNATACAGFWESYSYWFDGIPVSPMPGPGPVTMERRPTPEGMIMAIRYTVL